MNVIRSAPRVALLAFALGTAGVTATWADTTTTTSSTDTATDTGGGRHCHHHGSVLTAEERAKLKKAKDEALASNGALQTEQTDLKTQFEKLKSEGDTATKEDWKALHQKEVTFHQNLKSAMLLLDSSLTPIFAKLEAAHKDWHHHHQSEGL